MEMSGAELITNSFSAAQQSQVQAGNFKINSLRTNTTLRKDEWQHLDDDIIKTARIRLRAVGDLMSRGLTKPVNGMQVSVLQWQTQSKTSGDVSVSMDPQVQGDNEAVVFGLESLPLPFYHADYQIGERELNISRMGGQPLDTTVATERTADIAEKVENTLVNGLSTYTYGGGTIFGYTDHPDRHTETLALAWTAATGAEILDDVLALKQGLIDKKKYGPYVLYIPTAYECVLEEDFKAETSDTIRERIMAVSTIEDIKVLDTLPADNVLLVQLTADVVRMVVGMPLNNVQWVEKGGFTNHFKILTIMIPQFRVDRDGNLGVAHLA